MSWEQLLTIGAPILGAFSFLVGVIWQMHNRKMEQNHRDSQTRMDRMEKEFAEHLKALARRVEEDRIEFRATIDRAIDRQIKLSDELFGKMDKVAESIAALPGQISSLRATIAERYVERPLCDARHAHCVDMHAQIKKG